MGHPSSIIPNICRSALIAAFILAVVHWVAFAWLVYVAPMPYGELDLNHDGRVSLAEVDYAASYGERKIQVDDLECVEYFAYKDGLPLKVVCTGLT